jgi:hypothetical protein
VSHLLIIGGSDAGIAGGLSSSGARYLDAPTSPATTAGDSATLRAPRPSHLTVAVRYHRVPVSFVSAAAAPPAAVVAQAIGDNDAMSDEYHDTVTFRGARFTRADLTGATFRDCDLGKVKIVDSSLVDVNVSGVVANFVVNEVDVTTFVEAELERRHPERAQLREMRTADDYRATWDTIERLWSEAVARARRLPEPARHERVDDEWSFVETLRHLVFATDAWASRTVLDDPRPYHRLGYPASGYLPADAAAIGIDLDARPSFDEVMEARTDRMAVMRRIVDGLTDGELERLCARSPGPGYPDEPRAVRRCLRVVMREECEHHRYAVRDLAVLEAAGLTTEAADDIDDVVS